MPKIVVGPLPHEEGLPLIGVLPTGEFALIKLNHAGRVYATLDDAEVERIAERVVARLAPVELEARRGRNG